MKLAADLVPRVVVLVVAAPALLFRPPLAFMTQLQHRYPTSRFPLKQLDPATPRLPVLVLVLQVCLLLITPRQ